MINTNIEKGCPFRSTVATVKTPQGQDALIDISTPCLKEKCILYVENKCIFIAIFELLKEGEPNEGTTK
jgi:hypothetical protein